MALVYWLLVLSEGVYLGPRIVTLLYDCTASKYESIKQFDPFYERLFLGEPLLKALPSNSGAMLLDVACGTSRVARALASTGAWCGTVTGLDRSRAMIVAGQQLPGSKGRIQLVQGDALSLPFPAETFDAVTSLEALEFFPSMEAALREMVRVLKPGGILFITNRKGGARYYMPGHVRKTSEVPSLLENLGLTRVNTLAWQVNYDLVLGRKAL